MTQGELFTQSECEKLQNNISEKYFCAEETAAVIPDISECKCKGLMQSDLFSVSEITEINKEIQKKKHDAEVLEAQKTMDLPYFENPKNDDQMLFNYQAGYIKNLVNGDLKKSQDDWGKLIELSYRVTKRLIWDWLRKHRDIYLDDIAQDEKCMVAIQYVLRRYQKNVGWYVKKNFIGALKGGVIHAMKYETTMDRNTVSLEEEYAKYQSENQTCEDFL